MSLAASAYRVNTKKSGWEWADDSKVATNDKQTGAIPNFETVEETFTVSKEKMDFLNKYFNDFVEKPDADSETDEKVESIAVPRKTASASDESFNSGESIIKSNSSPPHQHSSHSHGGSSTSSFARSGPALVDVQGDSVEGIVAVEEVAQVETQVQEDQESQEEQSQEDVTPTWTVPSFTAGNKLNISGMLKQCRFSTPSSNSPSCYQPCSTKQSRSAIFDTTNFKSQEKIPDSFVYTAECQYCSFTCLANEYKVREDLGDFREFSGIPKWTKCLANNCRDYIKNEDERGFFSCHYKCSLSDHLAASGMKMSDIRDVMKGMEAPKTDNYSHYYEKGINPMNYRFPEGNNGIVVDEFVPEIDRNINVDLS